MTSVNSVLIVDDELAVRDIMSRWAGSIGLQARTASNADEALAALRTAHSDLAIVDVMMPGRDGLWLAQEIHREHPQTAVVIATAYAAILGTEPLPERPIADLLVKPFARDRFLLAVDRGRRWRKEALEEVQWHAELAAELTRRVEDACEEIERRGATGAEELEVLTNIGARAPDVIAHGERVARYAAAVARELNLAADLTATIERAARFHDIGKAAIPAALLSKPSPFTRGEQAIMRRHAEAGAEILASTRTLFELAPIVLASHEWFGGGGYPLKLAGEAIPLASRIIGVVDSYDAMMEDRAYRSRLGSREAIAELLRCSGTQFDPHVVTAFLGVMARQ
jgi:putative two-component system response regulator